MSNTTYYGAWAATDKQTTLDPSSMLMGWLTGRAVASQRLKTPESAKWYLYGHVASADETPDVYIGGVGYVGAVMPALPERDTTEYPYLFIWRRGTGQNIGYGAIATKVRLYCDSDGKTCLPSGEKFSYIASNYDPDYLGYWENTAYQTPWGPEGTLRRSNTPMWANYDMLSHEDGKTVYLAGTEPIPVYE